jgi:hypothetical protein
MAFSFLSCGGGVALQEKDTLEVEFANHKGSIELEQANMYQAIKVLQKSSAE